MSASLSLEQAPPLSVPLRFFLTAPLFGIAAAALLLWAGPAALASRWTPAALALAHLVGLGVLTMVMCGALFQLLPVLVGSRVARPLLAGGACHLLLALGCLSLAAGFLGAGAGAFRAAAALLGAGLAVFVALIGVGLARAPRVQDSVRGMCWALAGLALAAVPGLVLTLGHGRDGLPLLRGPLTDVHLAWATAGWVATLVAVVAWQVVPMFQMTAEYPRLLRRTLAPVACLLLLWLSVATLTGAAAWPPRLALALLLASFAVVTLQLLARRRRKVGDSSLAFWRLGMVSLAGAALAALAPPAGLAVAAAVLFLAGFALSVVNGMLYKIVPFLVWLHLQQLLAAHPSAIGRVTPPNMHAVLPLARTRAQFAAHAAALALLLAGLALPALLRPAALLWLLSFALLGLNLLAATRIYLDGRRRISAPGAGAPSA